MEEWDEENEMDEETEEWNEDEETEEEIQARGRGL